VDGPVRLLTLNYLARTTLTGAESTLFVDCFDVLIGCVEVVNDRVVVTQGMRCGEVLIAFASDTLRHSHSGRISTAFHRPTS